LLLYKPVVLSLAHRCTLSSIMNLLLTRSFKPQDAVLTSLNSWYPCSQRSNVKFQKWYP